MSRTRLLTTTLPNGETFYREIKVTRQTSCDYDFVVAFQYASGEWGTDGLTRYRKVAEQEAQDYRARGYRAEVLPLESILL